MSLSPAAAAAEASGLQAAAAAQQAGAVAGGACSLSDAELEAFLDDTVDLDELLSKHANWVLDMS
jgi:3-deoxy-D-manno-octulosonic acid (KDO) 8-phosphate synthase